jgi:hypothetical protein
MPDPLVDTYRGRTIMEETTELDLDRILNDLYGPVRTEDEAEDDPDPDPEPDDQADPQAADLERIYKQWEKATYG